MKYKYFLFIFIFLIINNTQAQDEPHIVIGIQSGISINEMRFTTKIANELLTKSKVNLFGNLSSDIRLVKKLYVGCSLNIRTKGYESPTMTFTDNQGNELGSGRYDYIFNYITIPVYASLYLGNKIKIRIGAGAYWGLLMKAKVESKIPVEGQLGSVDLTEQYPTSDMGLAARIGVLIPIYNNIKVTMDISDEFGLSILRDKNPFVNSNDFDGSHHSISAGCGLAFGF